MKIISIFTSPAQAREAVDALRRENLTREISLAGTMAATGGNITFTDSTASGESLPDPGSDKERLLTSKPLETIFSLLL